MNQWICLTLLFWNIAWADAPISQGERLFNENLYSDALLIFEEISQNDPSPEVLCRLVQTHYELGNYTNVLELVKEKSSTTPSTETDFELIYLKGLAHLQLGQTEEARQALSSYLALGSKSSLIHQSEAQFQLGLIQFSMSQFEESKKNFTKASAKSSLATLSKLYLARIDLKESKNNEAAGILLSLQKSLSAKDPLNPEIAYWLGRVYQNKGDYLTAVLQFERAWPQNEQKHLEWHLDNLYQMGSSYLKLADDPALTKEKQAAYFAKAESSLEQLVALAPQEHLFLALGECYLIKARRLENQSAYLAAEELLSKKELFTSPYALSQSILLRAEAAPQYAERDRLYQQLTQESSNVNGWYMRGMNDYEEGQSLLTADKKNEAKNVFLHASEAFKQAFLTYQDTDQAKAGLAIQYQALSLFYQQNEAPRRLAWNLLDQLIHQQPKLFNAIQNKAEIFYLSGLIASHLVKENNQNEFVNLAEKNLLEGTARFPQDSYTVDMLNLLGHLYLQNGRSLDSEKTFLKIADEFPQSPLAGEAWFWAASNAEELGYQDEIIKQYKRHVFEDYPDSPYAAEAYFSYYPYRDYLQGSRTPLKHLEAMPTKFPKTPLLVTSYYLIGLDHKKERLSLEGKAIRQKNLLAAIEAFHAAESTFDSLNLNGSLPPSELEYFVTLRYRSILERALSNLAIAEESQGAKRQIYLEYAEEVFNQVVNDFSKEDNQALAKMLIKDETYHRLWEESEFWLAHTYIQEDDDEAAGKILNQMLDKYKQANITKGYFLARTWFEKGMIAQRGHDYELALLNLSKAEDAAKGKVLSTDQRLDLKIQQSLCYRELKQLDQSMLILSQVINDDAISGLRLKAMCLRAELYELQGRPELALKQWEATSKKGGEWGQKAKEALKKLEK